MRTNPVDCCWLFGFLLSTSKADDIGWGELGWQGGGKHRGTPTDGLDAMAFEGMRFWSSYAEPSCTPSSALSDLAFFLVKQQQL